MRKHGFIVVVFCLFTGCGGGSAPAPTAATPPPSAPALTISSGAPPSGTAGAAYAGSGFSFTASGGVAPYSWSWLPSQGSSLPVGLTLSSTGLISGTPQLASTYNVTVSVSDSSSPAANVSANYAIAIAGTPVLSITSGPPPAGSVGVDYGPTMPQTFSCHWSPILGWHEVCAPCSSQSSCSSLPQCKGFSVNLCQETKDVFEGFTFTAAGGTSPYTWGASGMPPGIDVDPNSGQILGTPTMAGSYSVMVTVTDASSPAAQASATYVLDLSSSGGGMCVPVGGQCYAKHPCCAGLQCVPASTRAFCR
jgi:hypothetical protein